MSIVLNDKVKLVGTSTITIADTTKAALTPKLAIPKGGLVKGGVLKIHAFGSLTADSGSGTLKLDIMGGPTDSEAILVTGTTGDITTGTCGWRFDGEIVFRALTRDVSGTLTDGELIGAMDFFGNDHASAETLKLNTLSGTTATAIDSEEENTFYIAATLSNGSATEKILMLGCRFEFEK